MQTCKCKEVCTIWPSSCRLVACWCMSVPRISTHIRIWPACARPAAPGAPAPSDSDLRDADVGWDVHLGQRRCKGWNASGSVTWRMKVILLCVAVVECPDPNVLPYGSVDPPQEKYFVGNETTYECYSGHTLRGSMSRVCLPNGKWSGQTPICSRGSKTATPSLPLAAPRLRPLARLLVWVSKRMWLSCLSSLQRGITVPTLASHPAPQDQETHSGSATEWDITAETNCSWWAPMRGSVRRTASGLGLSRRATVRRWKHWF